MSNRFLQNTKFAKAQRAKQQEFGGFLDEVKHQWNITKKGWGDALGNPLDYGTRVVKEVFDYSDTNQESAKRNEHAWKRKLEIGKAYRDAGAWPKSVPLKLNMVRHAYPSLPTISNAIGVPPNSVADAFAQGAVFCFITAKMYNKPEFKQLGNQMAQKAKSAPADITKGAPVQAAMRKVSKAWLNMAKQSGIIPSWYNLIDQAKNMFDGTAIPAEILAKRIKQFGKANEIQWSQQIAAEAQGSLWDLAYAMRGWLGLAGLILTGVFAGPAIVSALPSIGRGAVSAGKATGKAIGKAGKATVSAGKSTASAIKSARETKEDISSLIGTKKKSELTPEELNMLVELVESAKKKTKTEVDTEEDIRRKRDHMRFRRIMGSANDEAEITVIRVEKNRSKWGGKQHQRAMSRGKHFTPGETNGASITLESSNPQLLRNYRSVERILRAEERRLGLFGTQLLFRNVSQSRSKPNMFEAVWELH